MQDCVLLFVDQRRRDLMPNMMIYFYLKKMGVKVILSSAYDFFMKYIFYKPKVVLQGNPDIYHGEWSKFISQYSILTCLPTEQSVTHPIAAKERVIQGHNPKSKWGETFTEGVYRFYLWGPFLFNLLKEEKQFSNKLEIVGSPRLSKFVYFSRDGRKENLNKKFTIGIAMENDLNNMNVANFIYLMRDMQFYDLGESVENFLCFSVGVTACLLNVIQMYANRADIDIIIRPRLSDDAKNYHFLTDNIENIVINSDDSTHAFFEKIDCLILAQSSIGTEAQMAGIPVISVYGLITDIINFFDVEPEGERLKHYWHPDSYKELAEMVERARDKKLLAVREPSAFLKFVSDVYIPSLKKGHPAKVIADDLKNLMENFSSIQNNFYNSRNERTFDFFRTLLPNKLRNKIIGGILFKNATKDNILYKILTAVIYYTYRVLFFIKYKFKRLDSYSCFVDFETNSFRKYKAIFDEVELLFENARFE